MVFIYNNVLFVLMHFSFVTSIITIHNNIKLMITKNNKYKCNYSLHSYLLHSPCLFSSFLDFVIFSCLFPFSCLCCCLPLPHVCLPWEFIVVLMLISTLVPSPPQCFYLCLVPLSPCDSVLCLLVLCVIASVLFMLVPDSAFQSQGFPLVLCWVFGLCMSAQLWSVLAVENKTLLEKVVRWWLGQGRESSLQEGQELLRQLQLIRGVSKSTMSSQLANISGDILQIRKQGSLP